MKAGRDHRGQIRNSAEASFDVPHCHPCLDGISHENVLDSAACKQHVDRAGSEIAGGNTQVEFRARPWGESADYMYAQGLKFIDFNLQTRRKCSFEFLYRAVGARQN